MSYQIINTSITQGIGLPSSIDFLFSASGDLSGSSEYWQVYDENGSFLTNVGQYNGCDCCGNTSYTSYTANSSQIQQWFSDGIVEFDLRPSYAINYCSINEISIDFNINGVNYNNTFSYGSQPPSSTIATFSYNDLLTASLFIPYNMTAGFYDLEVYDYNTNSWVHSANMFEVLSPPSVNSISPSSGEQGEYLSVSISTTNIGLDDYSGSTSQFRFSQGRKYFLWKLKLF